MADKMIDRLSRPARQQHGPIGGTYINWWITRFIPHIQGKADSPWTPGRQAKHYNPLAWANCMPKNDFNWIWDRVERENKGCIVL